MCINKWMFSVSLLLLVTIDNRTRAYSNQWTAKILGGPDVAQRVAMEHGFHYRHQIFEDLYHFDHKSVKKRSSEPHLEINSRLKRDTRVQNAEQQRILSRRKRDFVVKRGPASSRAILNDDRWPQMWYLNRGKGLDMNVQGAWADGITGHGIVVTILDDGLEKDHPDIYSNYDPQASYDVNSYDDDPMPRYDYLNSNRHGTRCAGEVAATANNSFCAVGVAYGAGVGGVRMLDGEVTDAVEARSLSFNSQHIDIYSASWGPDDDGKTVDGPGELATRAFIEGITKGRSGKGSIFVWASGNGGREHDNCNCDGYTNSIWTLSISSATENGLVPWYSEACSSTLATAYSSGSLGEKQIVTIDLNHQCTSSHTGTSASAPIAAGICALALEANRDLTWRDMQHIVVRTAKPANLIAADWTINGVGRNVSHSFGYGLMDATAMVQLAKKWQTVPEQHKCEMLAPHKNRSIPSRSQLTLDFHVKECSGVNFLEHVQAKITLSASRRGDLEITLTSPQGTKSTLLAKRPHDNSKTGFQQWPFMSVHTWGERPHGTWKLEVHNEGRYVGRAILHEWSLIFYGTGTLPDPTEYALYSSIAGSSISSTNIKSPKKPVVKTSNYSRNGLNIIGIKSKNNKLIKQQQQSQQNSGLNQAYIQQNQTSKKSKVRGQHKNGKSTNKPTVRPTVQSLRGLTFSRIATSKPRVSGSNNTASSAGTTIGNTTNNNSTPKAIPETPVVKLTTQLPKQQQIIDSVTSTSSLQRGLILMEPAAKAATNKVPVVFQQYPKIQQLYPLYPVYPGVRGVNQHATRAKGLDLLQDEQFDTRNLQLTDKASLTEWGLVFYGTETALKFDDELDKDKPIAPIEIDIPHNNAAEDKKPIDTEGDGDLWTGRQQVDLISHPEVQKPTTENHTSKACNSFGSHGCLECKLGWFISEGRCLSECPHNMYVDHDQRKNACIPCHYSCMTCSGPSDIDCTSCHADSNPIPPEMETFQCILKSIEWKTKSTVWFYRMTIVLGLSSILMIGIVIYLWISSSKKLQKIINHGYMELPLPNDQLKDGNSNRNLDQYQSESE
ncbi:furin-like protease 1 isoform X1 [Microplitis mediator]|uniref:furin-like protease 1 isoform X1 n=1 Tax=Microplitis mediator TaxID=375433 RepID=UPI002556FAA5|nr:furin-like protease 1 isoform X1 [Microplitis mediator]